MIDSILNSLIPLTLFSRLTGFHNFTVDPVKCSAKIATIDIVSIILTIFTTITMSIYHWSSFVFVDIEDLKTMEIGLPLLIYSKALSSIISMIWLFVGRHKIVKIVTFLGEIDDEISHFDILIDYDAHRKHLIRGIVKIFMCIILLDGYTTFIFTFVLEISSMSEQVFQMWMLLCRFVMIYQFLAGVGGITARVRNFSMIIDSLTPAIEEKITEITKIQENLVNLTSKFNRTYGFMAIVFFCNILVDLCISSFGLLIYKHVTFGDMYIMSCLTMHLLFQLFLLLYIISKIVAIDQVQRLIEMKLYGKLQTFFSEKEFCGKIQVLLAQILKFPLKFECNFFEFNWKFLFRVRNF